jgi:Tetratricopeptide repeat
MGCQKMDAVTYPNTQVVAFVSANMVPVRIRYDAEPLSSDFNIRWTPTIITLDPEGHEHHRTVGYLAPDELIPSLLLGIAKWRFDTKQYDLAEKGLDAVLDRYPDSDAAPEALYLRGVSRFKQRGDLGVMREVRRELSARYPESEWTRRAEPYEQAA